MKLKLTGLLNQYIHNVTFYFSIQKASGKDLCDARTKATGKPPLAALDYEYAGCVIVVDVLRRASTLDKETIQRAIADTDMDTMVGHVKYKKENYCCTPLVGGNGSRGRSGLGSLNLFTTNRILTSRKRRSWFSHFPNSLQHSEELR
ncbi:MAG: hypothetical protein JSW12_19915 [Deltaproteobacteria bacterium]|nr:MAG: hypothetical protein JSW12_19915 [Deltaproteobacteria bacterium]